jgi:uncharacterized membrane protein
MRRFITKDNVFVAVVLILSAYLLFSIDSTPPGEVFVTAKITQLEDNTELLSGWYKVGGQEITARIISGRFKGLDITAMNDLTGNLMLDRYVRVGDRAIFRLYLEKGNIQRAQLVDYDRQTRHIILFGIFAGLLILFARYTGIKALVSFVFTVLIMVKIGIPLIIKGHDPLFLCVAFALLFGTTTLLLVGGFSIRALSAIIGLFISILLTTCLTLIFGKEMHLSTAVSEKAIALFYSGHSHLDMERIFWGALIFGASGAMVDIAIAVATTIKEVVTVNPAIGARRLIRSGFEVGRATLGTMITTLLLAYVGCSLFLFLVFTANATHLARIINFNLISAEILRILAGSMGMVMIAPITAVVAGLLYHRFYGQTGESRMISKAEDSRV